MTYRTCYVLDDGDVADPGDVVTGDGKRPRLFHKDGRAVAYSTFGPKTRSVLLAEIEKNRAMKAEDDKPKPRRGYKTR